MPTYDESGARQLPRDLVLAFRPLHKRAFGLAVGLTAGLALFLVTVYALLIPGRPGILDLVNNFFPGYTVSWTGAIVGFLWATFAFFVGGWFIAFCRNFLLAASIWMARTRAELEATHDFLDHI